jgi:hypothetical protein
MRACKTHLVTLPSIRGFASNEKANLPAKPRVSGLDHLLDQLAPDKTELQTHSVFLCSYTMGRGGCRAIQCSAYLAIVCFNRFDCWYMYHQLFLGQCTDLFIFSLFILLLNLLVYFRSVFCCCSS